MSNKRTVKDQDLECCIQMINLMGCIFLILGPYERYLIKSSEKIGTKIAFLMSTKIHNQTNTKTIYKFKTDFEEKDLLAEINELKKNEEKRQI